MILPERLCFVKSHDSLLIRLYSFSQFSSPVPVRNHPLLFFVMPTSCFEQDYWRLLSDWVDEIHRGFCLYYAQIPSRRRAVAFYEVKCVQQKKQNGWQGRYVTWRESIAFCFIPEGPHRDKKARECENIQKHWAAGTLFHPVVKHGSIMLEIQRLKNSVYSTALTACTVQFVSISAMFEAW